MNMPQIMEKQIPERELESHSTKAFSQRVGGYKPSGIEWLGDIPEHWEVRKNKSLFKIKKNIVGNKCNEYTLLSLTIKGVIPRNLDIPKGKFPAEFNSYQEVQSEDLIFCLFDIEETPRTVGYSSFKGMITGAYTVVECFPDVFNKFLYYYYLSLDEHKKLGYLYTGLRKTIQKTTFLSIFSPLPPIEEQKTIVEYIEKETAIIDKAIERTEREIELIKEYKTTLISEVVTGKKPSEKLTEEQLKWLEESEENNEPENDESEENAEAIEEEIE